MARLHPGVLVVGGGVLVGLAVAATSRRGAIAERWIVSNVEELVGERLGRYFTVAEFERSNTAIARGINNTMPEAAKANARLLVAQLDKLREYVGVPVKLTSGFRGPALNQAVRGDRDSAHLDGSAADIVVDGWDSETLAATILASGIEFGELGWYTTDHHVHITRPGRGGAREVWRKTTEAANGGEMLVMPRSELAKAANVTGVPEPEWKDHVLKAVVDLGEQSGWDELNLNSDGQGLSAYILQWTQRSTELGKLLRRAATSFPLQTAAAFGPSWKAMVAACEAGSLAPVDGAVLWAEPWAGRFRAAGRTPWMQAVQRNHAFAGFHWQQAMEAARILDARTERSLALIFDRAVPRPGSVANTARKVMADYADQPESVRIGAFVGSELALVSSRWRDAHTARFDRIRATPTLSDAPVVDWTTAVV